MAFKFGKISSTDNKKTVAFKETQSESTIVYENIKGDYYMFLLDQIVDVAIINLLKKNIQAVGITSFIICNSILGEYKKDSLKGGSLTSFMRSNQSDWLKIIKEKERDGSKLRSIMAFGSALYQINGSADILASDFYSSFMLTPYYYIGSRYQKINTYVFPVDSVMSVFPELSFRKTFFIKQLENMTKEYKWTPDLTEPNIVIIKTQEEADKVLLENQKADLCAFDLETSGLDFVLDKIHCLTLSFDGITGYYIPWHLVNKRLLSVTLKSCKRLTGANPKFDIKFLWKNGVSKTVNVTDAVDRLAHCINSGRKSGLKPLSYFYTAHGGYDVALDDYKKMSGVKDYTKIPESILSKYAAMDAIVTWQVQKQLDNQCLEIDEKFPNEKYPEWTIERWYKTQLMEIYKEIIRVEYRGIFVNPDIIKKYREQLKSMIKDKETKLRELWHIDNNFNIDSGVELGKLFEKFGWTCYGRTKQNVYVTNEEALIEWSREKRPGIDLLQDMRSEKTFLRSFLGNDDGTTGWAQYIRKNDDNFDVINQGYHVMGTETFRFIGVNPNFQNIPSRGAESGFIKKCIDTPPAESYIVTDKDGIEHELAPFELINTNQGYKTAEEVFKNPEEYDINSKDSFITCELSKGLDQRFFA